MRTLFIGQIILDRSVPMYPMDCKDSISTSNSSRSLLLLRLVASRTWQLDTIDLHSIPRLDLSCQILRPQGIQHRVVKIRIIIIPVRKLASHMIIMDQVVCVRPIHLLQVREPHPSLRSQSMHHLVFVTTNPCKRNGELLRTCHPNRHLPTFP